jgi:hypothetical protein
MEAEQPKEMQNRIQHLAATEMTEEVLSEVTGGGVPGELAMGALGGGVAGTGVGVGIAAATGNNKGLGAGMGAVVGTATGLAVHTTMLGVRHAWNAGGKSVPGDIEMSLIK